MIETHDLYLRALAIPKKKKKRKNKAENYATDEPKWPENVLVFDTESRITVDQSLTFGAWQRCKLVGQNYEVVEEGIFYADGLPAKDRKVLEAYMQSAVSDVTSFPPPFSFLLAYAVHEEGILARPQARRFNGSGF